jgi:hypothetical protein
VKVNGFKISFNFAGYFFFTFGILIFPETNYLAKSE